MFFAKLLFCRSKVIRLNLLMTKTPGRKGGFVIHLKLSHGA